MPSWSLKICPTPREMFCRPTLWAHRPSPQWT